MSSPRHPQDPRRNTPAEEEGVPKLHAREFTVPPGWYERRGRSSHPPKELRPAEDIPTAEPPVVLATELVSSAQYESAPRIDSVPPDGIDAGPTFSDPNPLDLLHTDSDVTTPFNAEVRELQALTTQPSLRARQRQAAKHRILLVGVLFVLLCASALFVAGLVRTSPPSPSALAPVHASPVEARIRVVAKTPAKPGELPNAPAAPAAGPRPSQPQNAAGSKPMPDSGVTPNTETKSKLITRTPTF
ncbi:MAG TPA: hypothetical protein VI072_11060 [Polyangiaceae bacterium]